MISSASAQTRLLPWNPEPADAKPENWHKKQAAVNLTRHLKTAQTAAVTFTNAIQSFLDVDRPAQRPCLVIIGADGFATNPLRWHYFLTRQNIEFDLVFAMRANALRFEFGPQDTTAQGRIYYFLRTSSKQLGEAVREWVAPSTGQRNLTAEAGFIAALANIQDAKDVSHETGITSKHALLNGRNFVKAPTMYRRQDVGRN